MSVILGIGVLAVLGGFLALPAEVALGLAIATAVAYQFNENKGE